METVNLETGYFNHPKTRRLVGLLGKGAEVLPIRLWCYIAEYHGEDGRLTGYSIQEIEALTQWEGEEGAMVQAMVKVGLLDRDGDTFVVHNWVVRNGHIGAFKDRAKRAAEGRWRKIRGRDDAPSDSTPSDAVTQSNSGQSDGTASPQTAPSIASSNPTTMLSNAPSIASSNPTTVLSNAPSIAKPMLEQCPTVLPTDLTTHQHHQATGRDHPSARAELKHSAAAAGVDISALEAMLQQQWGANGNVGRAVLMQCAELVRKHGQEKVEYAIREAATHNVCSLAYVLGILEPKGKSIRSAAPRKKIVQCQYCGEQVEEMRIYSHQQFDVCKGMKPPSKETMRKAIEEIEKLADHWKA